MECRKEMNEEKRGLVRSVAWRLDRLGGHVDATTLTKSMYKWCEAQADRAKNELDYELDDLRKRTALIGTRAGVAYAIMEHLDDFERTGVLTVSSSAIKFARVVADFCLDMQYMKFSVMMRERKEAVGEKWRTAERKVYTADVYDKLPEFHARRRAKAATRQDRRCQPQARGLLDGAGIREEGEEEGGVCQDDVRGCMMFGVFF